MNTIQSQVLFSQPFGIRMRHQRIAVVLSSVHLGQSCCSPWCLVGRCVLVLGGNQCYQNTTFPVVSRQCCSEPRTHRGQGGGREQNEDNGLNLTKGTFHSIEHHAEGVVNGCWSARGEQLLLHQVSYTFRHIDR